MVSAATAPLLLATDRIPNQEAIALSPVAGWILLLCGCCVGLLLALDREALRRIFLRLEDPRPMGLFRILFGLCAMANINGLWEHFHYLFTDEGIFLTDVARHVYARGQFVGFGNGLSGDPYGFFDAAAFWEWLKGPRYSLLLFWDSPTAFWIHWVAFQLSITLMVVGLWTRWTKWIAWFLFHSIILRNNLFWEGTENVFRTFFFYLALSRCDGAYSVDNWLRCRRLRRAGRLSTRDGPGGGAGAPASAEHPSGLAPVYAPVPAWPRMLVILQIAAIYLDTGVVKNGGVWAAGDAFYYALNLDHFWRLPPQWLSSVLGTNLFRINTHVTHYWEACFPLVVVGLTVRWARREGLPPKPRGHRLLRRGLWVLLGLASLGLVLWLLPVHYAAPPGWWLTLDRLYAVISGGWLACMGLLGWLVYRLEHKPFQFRLRGHSFVIDTPTFLRWCCGRRLWLFLGITFHSHLILLMNIGWFSPGLLSGYVCFLNGEEVAAILASMGRGLARVRVPGIPSWITRREAPTPGPDLTLGVGHRDGHRLPEGLAYGLVPLTVAGVGLAYADVWSFGWTLWGAAALLIGTTLVLRRRDVPDYTIVPLPSHTRQVAPGTDRQHTLVAPWAYGPLGRVLVGSLVLYHCFGVALWLAPDKDSFSKWHGEATRPFRFWLETTQTTQGWQMFAPNPPRANVFMKVIVTDLEGTAWDMNTDVYAGKPIPWIWYSRQGKMNRRIGEGEGLEGSWYQKWHARWFCRQWALEHGGVEPKSVELVKVSYGVPTPEWVAKNGAYDWMERLRSQGQLKSLYRVTCAAEVDGQLPDRIRERHGLPPSDKVRRWDELRGKKAAWDRRRALERANAEKRSTEDAE
jgi:hypothetical protein